VERYPDAFEPVELVTRGGEPRDGAPVAISRATFIAYREGASETVRSDRLDGGGRSGYVFAVRVADSGW
jgi:hypothetical protein